MNGPGPWAGGYQFPDGTTGPPAVQPSQGTPQPPTVDQSAPDPSQQPLGAVTQDAGLSPSEIKQRFNQYLQLTQAANAAGHRDYLPEDTKPGILANILTFGMAGAADADYRRAYNAAIDRHNSGLNVLAAKQALDMTNQDMRSAHGDLGQQINLLRLKMAMDQNEFNNLIKGLGINLRLKTYERGELVPPPKTPEERAAHWDVGEKWIADPDHPNFGRWTKVGGDGGAAAPPARGAQPNVAMKPPAPGSPLGNEMGVKPSGAGGAGGTAGGGGGGTTDSGADLTTEQLNARKAADAARAEAAKANALQLNEVQNSGAGIIKWLQAPDYNRAINNVLPSKETSRQTAGVAQAANPWVMSLRGAVGDQQTQDDVAYIKNGLTKIVPAIKSLAAGSKGLRINIPEIELIGKDWKRLAAGKMNREEAAAFKRTFIKVYNQVVTGLGGQAVPDESSESQTKTPANTPAGTVTSSSVPGGGGGLPKSGTTSGGIQYRVLP